MTTVTNKHRSRYNPESSKGERMKDPPTPDDRIAEAKRMKAELPTPPAAHASNDEIQVWLHKAAAVSIAHAEWAWRPDIWNKLFNADRMRQQETMRHLRSAAEEEAKRRVAAEAAERAAKQQDELGEVLRSWRTQ